MFIRLRTSEGNLTDRYGAPVATYDDIMDFIELVSVVPTETHETKSMTGLTATYIHEDPSSSSSSMERPKFTAICDNRHGEVRIDLRGDPEQVLPVLFSLTRAGQVDFWDSGTEMWKRSNLEAFLWYEAVPTTTRTLTLWRQTRG